MRAGALARPPRDLLRDRGFSIPPCKGWFCLQQLLNQATLDTSWLYGLVQASVLTDLRLLKAGDGHEDVVKVGAAPPQHVHPLLASFLPQFIDGVFCTRGRSRQRKKELTPNSTVNPWATHSPELPQVLTAPSHYLPRILKSPLMPSMSTVEIPSGLRTGEVAKVEKRIQPPAQGSEPCLSPRSPQTSSPARDRRASLEAGDEELPCLPSTPSQPSGSTDLMGVGTGGRCLLLYPHGLTLSEYISEDWTDVSRNRPVLHFFVSPGPVSPGM